MAMKEVEVRVRTIASRPASLVGVALVHQAFRPPKWDSSDAGPLHLAADEPRGGRRADVPVLRAIGLFKNSASHRRVDFEDPTEAAEVVLLADLLMRLLNKIPPR